MKQGLWTESAVQLYPVGTRIQVGQRVFHYSRALTALLTGKRGQGDGGTLLEMLNAYAPALAGDLSVTLITAAPVVHEFQDGWFAAHDGAAVLQSETLLRIKDNDAPVGANTTFYLKDPIVRGVRIAGADTCDLHRNIYSNLSEKGGGGAGIPYQSVVCVPLIPITIGYYFWGQTWGPCLGIPHELGGLGVTPDERAVYFANDGSIGAIGAGSITDICQYAGYMLGETRSAAGVAGDDIFYMLQLAP